MKVLNAFHAELNKDLGDKVFDNDYQLKQAKYFLEKSNLLFALAVDYPGFTKMPLAYVAAAKAELKRLGFKVEKGGRSWKAEIPAPGTYRLFWQGPRHGRTCYGTPKCYANAFKLFFYGLK